MLVSLAGGRARTEGQVDDGIDQNATGGGWRSPCGRRGRARSPAGPVADLEAALAAAGGDPGMSAQTRLEVLLDSSPAGISIWDATDRLVAYNSQYAGIFFQGHEHLVELGLTFIAQSERFISLAAMPSCPGPPGISSSSACAAGGPRGSPSSSRSGIAGS